MTAGKRPIPKEKDPSGANPPHSKLVVGLAGGIGSGKSTVARMMGQFGGYVIDADALARQALDRPQVRQTIAQWWGSEFLGSDGSVDRRKLGVNVFDDPEQRRRLEGLIHPLVAAERASLMAEAQADPRVRFIVQDVPLLFEVGLDKECDYTVFVEASYDTRLARVEKSRGWDRAELERREKNQWPLDKKRAAADAIVVNDGDEAQCLAQVRSLLNRILSDELNVPAAE